MGSYEKLCDRCNCFGFSNSRSPFSWIWTRVLQCFVGAGRWPTRARRFDPQARRARLHLEITNAKSATVIDLIWNSVFVVVVAHATFRRSSSAVSGKCAADKNLLDWATFQPIQLNDTCGRTCPVISQSASQSRTVRVRDRESEQRAR